MSSDAALEALSRDELIARVRQLELQAGTRRLADTTGVSGSAGHDPDSIDAKVRGVRSDHPGRRQVLRSRQDARPQRPLDFSRYRRRYVAFKFAYLGWHYNGLVQQATPTELPTVEEEIFRALLRCRLIEHPDTCRFSRCGRTDKGVSAMGQVMALEIRSQQVIDTDAAPAEDSEGDALSFREPPWIDQLNGVLPDSIRVYAYDDTIADDFDARFSCRKRHYKYLLAPEVVGCAPLDVGAMQEACGYLLGEHDFRNLCKLDASKQITNFKRTIVRCTVTPLVDAAPARAPRTTHPDTGLLVLDLEGSAFLWHQVRCIAAILIIIGQRLEQPTLMRDLLDVARVPTKPIYDMADAWPLTLYDCDFGDAVRWKYAGRDDHAIDLANKAEQTPRVLESAFATMHAARIKDTISTFLLGAVAGPQPAGASSPAPPHESGTGRGSGNGEGRQGINLGDGRLKGVRTYTPVLQRRRMEDVSVLNAAYAAKQSTKGKLLPKEKFLLSQASAQSAQGEAVEPQE